MLKYFLSFDIVLTDLINKIIPHNSYFDIFFSFFSLNGSSFLIWIVIVILLVAFEEIKDKRFVFYFLVSFLAAVIISNYLLKNIFQRPRPQIPLNYVVRNGLKPFPTTTTCPKDLSFPSGHATAAFAAAATLAFFDKKRKYVYYFIAGLIGLSRIYLGCHYFLDVVCGGFFGYLISRAILLTTFQLRRTSRGRL